MSILMEIDNVFDFSSAREDKTIIKDWLNEWSYLLDSAKNIFFNEVDNIYEFKCPIMFKFIRDKKEDYFGDTVISNYSFKDYYGILTNDNQCTIIDYILRDKSWLVNWYHVSNSKKDELHLFFIELNIKD